MTPINQTERVSRGKMLMRTYIALLTVSGAVYIAPASWSIPL